MCLSRKIAAWGELQRKKKKKAMMGTITSSRLTRAADTSVPASSTRVHMSSPFGGAYHVRDKRFVPNIENTVTTPYTVIAHKDAGT